MIYYYLRNLLFLTFQMANTFSWGENHIWAKKKYEEKIINLIVVMIKLNIEIFLFILY
jgi:hypothetical protein